MMRSILNRMMRPRDLVLQFHEVRRDGESRFFNGVNGVLTTSQQLRPGDIDRVRKLDARLLVDGQIVKIKR